MYWFIPGVILALIGLVVVLVNPKIYQTNYLGVRTSETSTRPFGAGAVLVGALCILMSCFAIVGTRNVGVPTVFGKPTEETYSAGLNFKAPWVSVTDIDATVQVEEYNGDSCIYVKIGDGGSACVSLAYRWRINPDAADEVYEDYRNSDLEINDAVRKALVSTNIKAAINEVLGTYNPLDGAELTANMTPEELSNAQINVVPDYQQLNADIQDNLETKLDDVGGLVDVQSITVSYIKLPDGTQQRIDAFNQAVQETKIALQEVATKNAQADGNRVLAESLQDPNVLVSKCLDALADGSFTAPAGFSCWPGNNGSVVIPATK